MASGSYMTPIYSRSQSEVQGDLHKRDHLKQKTRSKFKGVRYTQGNDMHRMRCVDSCLCISGSLTFDRHGPPLSIQPDIATVQGHEHSSLTPNTWLSDLKTPQ
ncbi:hypothetical protein TNCV_4023361 [Trichonephila clavipes]|nr:hypothetical protein TNCV_4023361 [Trichonephila clavipes]